MPRTPTAAQQNNVIVGETAAPTASRAAPAAVFATNVARSSAETYEVMSSSSRASSRRLAAHLVGKRGEFSHHSCVAI